jgi:hypothetical protein
MFNREKAIQDLLADDINTVTECIANRDFEYLSNILEFGVKGWRDLTDEELMQELQDRDISYLYGETE